MNRFASRRNRLALVTGTAVLAVVFAGTVSPASADPIAVRQFVAAGADTAKDLFNAYSNGYERDDGVHVDPAYGRLDSYDAYGSPTINPRGTTFNRPSGSIAGRAALSASWKPGSFLGTSLSHDIDLTATSSRPPSEVSAGAANDNLTSIPLARDAISVAIHGTSLSNFTTNQLNAIFGDADFHQNVSPTVFTVGDIRPGLAGDPKYITAVTGAGAVTAETQLHPKIPLSTSGTRAVFLHASGLTAVGSFVDDKDVTSGVANTLQENNAAEIPATGDIVPFSVGSFIAQSNGISPDTGVASVDVKSINGTSPYAGSTTLTPGALYGSASMVPSSIPGVFNRDLYTVVPTAKIATTSPDFNTYGSGLRTLAVVTLPGAVSTIHDFGFVPLTYSAITTNWIHSSWS